MFNAAGGGLCVIAGSDDGLFGRDAEAYSIATGLMEEVAAVGRAEGANLPPELPGQMMAAMSERASGHVSSITVDRLEGRPTEWDARNGVVVRLARKHGIEVPMNRVLTTLIRLGEPSAGVDTD